MEGTKLELNGTCSFGKIEVEIRWNLGKLESEGERNMEREWNGRIENNSLYMRVGRKGGIGKIWNMETWKKKMRKYQENWNVGKHEIGKY